VVDYRSLVGAPSPAALILVPYTTLLRSHDEKRLPLPAAAFRVPEFGRGSRIRTDDHLSPRLGASAAQVPAGTGEMPGINPRKTGPCGLMRSMSYRAIGLQRAAITPPRSA